MNDQIWSFMIILKDHLIEATNPQVWTLESWLGNTEGEIGVLFGLIQLPQQDDGRRKSLIRSAFLLRFFFFFQIFIFWFHLPASADIGSPLVAKEPFPTSLPHLGCGIYVPLRCCLRRWGEVHACCVGALATLGFGIRGEGSGGWI